MDIAFLILGYMIYRVAFYDSKASKKMNYSALLLIIFIFQFLKLSIRVYQYAFEAPPVLLGGLAIPFGFLELIYIIPVFFPLKFMPFEPLEVSSIILAARIFWGNSDERYDRPALLVLVFSLCMAYTPIYYLVSNKIALLTGIHSRASEYRAEIEQKRQLKREEKLGLERKKLLKKQEEFRDNYADWMKTPEYKIEIERLKQDPRYQRSLEQQKQIEAQRNNSYEPYYTK